MKGKKVKTKTEESKVESKQFEWKTVYEEAFDIFRAHISDCSSTRISAFSKEFILAMDALLEGLGAIPSKQGNDGISCATAQATR